jgi:hypothetical protein
MFAVTHHLIASASHLYSTIVEHVSPNAGPTRESRMYSQVDSLALLHTHINAAPYIRQSSDASHYPAPAGLEINMWQDPSDPCGVQAVSVRINWVKSLGLIVLRYRMSLLAWTTGLGAIVIYAQYRHYRLTGKYSSCN